jgi:hypothetical protein
MITRNNPVLITLAIGALFLSMLNICRLADLSSGEAVASRRNAPPRTLFVFLAGIEGTGHHLYETLYNEKSVKLGYIDRITGLAQDLVDLQSALYNTGEPERLCLPDRWPFRNVKSIRTAMHYSALSSTSSA